MENTLQDMIQKLLSDTTVFTKYSGNKKDSLGEERKETYEELIDRNMQLHIKKFPYLKDKILYAYKEFVLTKKVMPSMRSLQFAGKGIEKRNSRIYNCSYAPVSDIYFFPELMFNLLCGTGVGFSVRQRDIEQLPSIVNDPGKKEEKGVLKYTVQDSIEGWADAILILMRSYFDKDYDFEIEFMYDEIREKGSKISTGGLAPGHIPLKRAIEKIKEIFSRKKHYSRLTSLELNDIVCHLADCILAGGIRRSALICLFSENDLEMMACKTGQWYIDNPQRARANNSVVLSRKTLTIDKIETVLNYSRQDYGEPGFFLTNSEIMGTNPCAEIALYPHQFCNLTTINFNTVNSQAELEERLKIATFIGTLQASYTDFRYLSPRWKRNTEKESLLGVSLTGLARKDLYDFDFKKASKLVIEENEKTARMIGINPASRIGCVKPEGTSSLVLGTASGIHPYHAQYYIRRVRVEKNSFIDKLFRKYLPTMVEDDVFSSSLSCLCFPIKAPETALIREEDSLDEMFNRIEFIFDNWIKPTHRSGENYHNVSATVSVKDNEWSKVSKKVFELKDKIGGVTFLNYDGGNYQQAPFEELNKEQYNQTIKEIEQYIQAIQQEGCKEIDLWNLIEHFKKTSEVIPRIKEEYVSNMEIACAGGKCEL